MIRKSFLITAGLAMLVLASMACALPFSEPAPVDQQQAVEQTLAARQPGAAETPAAKAPAPTAKAKNPAQPSPTPIPPTPKPAALPALPVGMRQGLASLNSYQIIFSQVYEGPSSQDKVQMTNETRYNKDGERSHVRLSNLSSTKDEPSDEVNTSDRYQIGSKVCTLPVDEGESALSDSDPQAEEMASTLAGLVDMSLYVEDPILVGEETLNGVKTRHYTFKVGGLGKKSGAEVIQSSGEYWIAADGLYLVKYQATLETRSAPQDSSDARLMRAVITYELTMINQPVVIEMPAECK